MLTVIALRIAAALAIAVVVNEMRKRCNIASVSVKRTKPANRRRYIGA